MILEPIDKNKLIQLVKQYATPLYCYDRFVIESNYKQLKFTVSSDVDIFYSIKANPNIAICEVLKNMEACAEVCSYYELRAVIKAGFKANDIIFVGPAKSDKAIKLSLQLNIYAIVCESIDEYKRIVLMAKNLKLVANVALRINPRHISKRALLKMGGTASQFGIDEEIVLANKDFFTNCKHINLRGIHIYNGTRILCAQTVIDNCQYTLNLAQKIQTAWKITFDFVDMGGGFGVAYFSDEKSLDLDRLQQQLKPLITRYKKNNKNTRLIVESGRYLVASGGLFISRVLDIKTSKGELFAITDGGTNCHMAAVGIDSLFKRNFPVDCLRDCDKVTAHENYNITGPLCTPGDVIAKKIKLPKLSVGDYIIIKKSGAYGPTASPVLFLSHGFPAEVLYDHNSSQLIRQRFNATDFFANQFKLINKEIK